MKKFISFCFLMFACFSFTQQPTTAKIKSIEANGWHKILLPSQIRSNSKTDLSDFRILDNNRNEIPYFLSNNEMLALEFVEFPMVQKIVIPKKSTSIIFENPKKAINKIVFSINNSQVNKWYAISGSNNKTDWFGLINTATFNDLASNNSTSSYKTIELPLSDYKFYKIELNDKTSLPINILKIGIFVNKMIKPALTTLTPKNISVTQNKNEKNTLIQIKFNIPEEVNQISFVISDPKLYNRSARIYVNQIRKIKRKIETYKKDISFFTLNSDSQNIFDIPKILEKQFYIEIQNLDNQPLEIDKINFSQIPIFAISELKINQNYTIKTGNSKSLKPEYDLQNFIEKIPNSIPEAQIIEIKQQNPEFKTEKNKQFWQQSWFLWFCIVIVALAISFFTLSLIKDLKNNS